MYVNGASRGSMEMCQKSVILWSMTEKIHTENMRNCTDAEWPKYLQLIHSAPKSYVTLLIISSEVRDRRKKN